MGLIKYKAFGSIFLNDTRAQKCLLQIAAVLDTYIIVLMKNYPESNQSYYNMSVVVYISNLLQFTML